VLPPRLIKYANLNKTTVLHAAGSANRLLNNTNKLENENTFKPRSYLQDSE
jgi:hypothetical protein